MVTCCLFDCDLPAAYCSLCCKHYSRLQAHGNTYTSNRHFWSCLICKGMYHNAKARARREGLTFALTPEDIVIPTLCPALGIRLERKGGRIHDASPSLDRIEPSRGYTSDNVQVISYLANRIKTNATPEQVMAMATYMKRIHARVAEHKR